MASLSSRWKDRRQSTNIIDLRRINPSSFSIYWLVGNQSTANIIIDTDGRAYDHGSPTNGGNVSFGLIPALAKPRGIPDEEWFPDLTIAQKIGLATVVFHLIGTSDPSKIFVNPPADERDIGVTQLLQAIVNNS